jgi:Regulator of chromosome condensation (RCC1) repeat
MACNTAHACVAATNEDDPNGRCAGTCDSTGACKSKQGQLCNTVPGLCISGTTCAPDGYCCNTACSGACVACDLPGFQGTCTNLAANTAPHSNHPSCGGTGNCAGACGSGGACSFPTAACGSGPTCSGINIVGQSSCSAGSCVPPAAQPCAADFICSANACKNSCSADGDCASGFCEAGTCHLSAVSIAAGFFDTCVVLSDGSVRCWGDNYYGELGIGTVTQTGIDGSATPVAVTGLPTKAVSITAGSEHNCAVLSDGSVWCWGDNSSGQLGNTTVTGSVPTPVKAALSGSASAIAAGEEHVCALVGGAVWCWGGEDFGQLGNGMVLGQMSPNWTATPAKVSGLGTVSTIACGAGHTCAISGGVASCWGDDNYGQLGNNAVGNNPQGLAGWPVPQAVDFSGTAVAITGGNEHTCMLDNGGNVYCWGENDLGQVGDNVNDDANVLFPTYVSNNISAPIAIAAGGDHSCAINIGGSVVCWGYPLNGQLGDAAATVQYLPEPVVGLNSPAVALALGGEHTCAIVKNGSVWCWGDNNGGQLGNGTVTSGATPVQVSGW